MNTMDGAKRAQFTNTKASKRHPKSAVWLSEHPFRGLFGCLSTWTTSYHRSENEFQGLSKYPSG